LIRLWRAYDGFTRHDGSLVAAGIAYYVALSFFPLMLVLVAGVGFAVRGTAAGQDAKERILSAIAQQASPDLSEQVKLALDATSSHAPTGGTIGFIALVVTAVAIFAQIDHAFDRIWSLGVERRETWLHWIRRAVFARFKALAMLLGVAAFVLTAMIASVAWSGVQKAIAAAQVEPWLSWGTGLALNVALNFLAFAVVYKYVPKEWIHWGEALRASLVAAPLWEVGRQLLSIYLLRLNYPTAYGIIGSFLAIMLWAYYAMIVLLFGAEFVRVLERERTESKREMRNADANL
jgi:membrane protein